MSHTFSRRSVERIVDAVRVVEADAQSAGATPAGRSGRLIDIKIVSATEYETEKWDYNVRIMVPGGTSHSGLKELSTIEYPARNTWEELTRAGYQSANVSGIHPLPNGATLRGRWIVRDGVAIISISERNEPICGT